MHHSDKPDSQRRHIIDDEQADIVRQIFERYVEGASCRTIAKELNEQLIAMSPKAAKEYRRQITLALDKDPRASDKARAILRKLLGPIDLRPGPDKNLWADYKVCSRFRGADSRLCGRGIK